MYWFVEVQTCTKLEQHTSFDQAPSALRLLRVSADLLAFSSRTVFFLMAVSSTVRPPRRGLPRPNFHSHWLTSYTLLPRLPSAAAESAQPTGKPEPLNLLNECGIVGVELPARNKGKSGTLPSNIKARCRERLIQFEHCSSLHRSMGGKIQLLKSAEKDQFCRMGS